MSAKRQATQLSDLQVKSDVIEHSFDDQHTRLAKLTESIKERSREIIGLKSQKRNKGGTFVGEHVAKRTGKEVSGAAWALVGYEMRAFPRAVTRGVTSARAPHDMPHRPSPRALRRRLFWRRHAGNACGSCATTTRTK